MNQDSFQSDDRFFKALAVRSETTVCSEGWTLFKQGTEPQRIYLVLHGEACLVMLSPIGKIVWSLRAGPGSVLGLPAAVGNVPYTLTAYVRRGSIVGSVRLGDLHKLLKEEPSLYPSVLKILASEIRAARTALAEFDGSPLSSSQNETRSRAIPESLTVV